MKADVSSAQTRIERERAAPPVLLAAAWIAIAGGTLEATFLAFNKLVLGNFLHLSPHFVWMTPLGNVLFLTLPAFGVLLLNRLLPRLVTRPVAAGLFAFLVGVGLLFLFPRLHRIAMFVLAGGIGVQCARLVAARPAGSRALMRATLPWLVACAAVAGLLVQGVTVWRERQSLAQLREAQAGAPNILLLILDTVRAASLSLYGNDRPTTPNLDRFAQRGVVFDRAISASPWTLPAHAAMFTGRHAREQTSNWEHAFDNEFPTVAEVLSDNGYATAGFVANVWYGTYEHGLNRGFAHYEDFGVSLGQTLNSSSLASFVLAGRPGYTINALRKLIDNVDYLGRKYAPDVGRDFLDWLDRRPADRPFFAFLNYIDAHWPYVSPADLREQFDVEERWGYNVPAYEAAIAGIDRAVGALIDTLDARGVLDNTVVIVASDHGEHLGEHDRTGHGNSLYMENLYVPLVIVHGRSVPAGVRIADFVTTRSLAATMLDLAGIRDQGGIRGHTLRAFWDSTATGVDAIFSSARQTVRTNEELPISKGDMHSLIENGHQFIHNGDNSEELYDLRTDMAQQRDLASESAVAELLDWLREAAARLLLPEPAQ